MFKVGERTGDEGYEKRNNIVAGDASEPMQAIQEPQSKLRQIAGYLRGNAQKKVRPFLEQYEAIINKAVVRLSQAERASLANRGFEDDERANLLLEKLDDAEQKALVDLLERLQRDETVLAGDLKSAAGRVVSEWVQAEIAATEKTLKVDQADYEKFTQKLVPIIAQRDRVGQAINENLERVRQLRMRLA